MDELISKIIEIENQAQEVISDAKKAKDELGDKLKAEVSELNKDIQRRKNNREEAIKSYEEGDAQKKITAMEEVTQNQLKSLDDKYRANKEQWIAGILENVIG